MPKIDTSTSYLKEYDSMKDMPNEEFNNPWQHIVVSTYSSEFVPEGTIYFIYEGAPVKFLKIDLLNKNKLCPRCSHQMIKKQTDQYGLIDKCINCDYC